MTKMSPSEALVETLVAAKVSDIFGIVGSAYMDALDLFPAAGIRFIPTVHEQGAAHMADGYARASGQPGVCIAQNGPGVTNFVTAIAAAYWAHSPVVAITPEAGTMSTGLGGFQEIDQLAIFSAITKYQAHVSNPRRIAELAKRCFERAETDRGPAQLNIPRDFFYGEYDYAIRPPKPISVGLGDEQAISRAVDLIANAEHPVVIAGGGVQDAAAVQACAEFAERLAAPVVTSYLHNDSFPASHPLWCGPLGYQGSKAAMTLLSRSDLVVALGSRLGPFGTLPQYGLEYWPEGANVIQVDADAAVLGKTKDITCGICGDCKAVAEALTSRLANRPLKSLHNRQQREETIATEKARWEKELSEWVRETDPFSLNVAKGDDEGLHPRSVLQELERALPANAMVSTDIGNICSVSNSYLRFNHPRSMFAAMSFGNCGYAFPVIVGAKVAAPDRPAVAYVGDGAWAMSFGEVLTCVRENIPVTAVVFNNRQWGAEKKNQVDFFSERFVGTDLQNPSFAEIARCMGARGVCVNGLDQVGDALRECTNAQDDGVTSVIEILVTRELGDPFRRDALSKPKRYLKKYQAYR